MQIQPSNLRPILHFMPNFISSPLFLSVQRYAAGIYIRKKSKTKFSPHFKFRNCQNEPPIDLVCETTLGKEIHPILRDALGAEPRAAYMRNGIVKVAQTTTK